jgi:hypothetical protein
MGESTGLDPSCPPCTCEYPHRHGIFPSEVDLLLIRLMRNGDGVGFLADWAEVTEGAGGESVGDGLGEMDRKEAEVGLVMALGETIVSGSI